MPRAAEKAPAERASSSVHRLLKSSGQSYCSGAAVPGEKPARGLWGQEVQNAITQGTGVLAGQTLLRIAELTPALDNEAAGHELRS